MNGSLGEGGQARRQGGGHDAVVANADTFVPQLVRAVRTVSHVHA